jgi:hypothetical protein
LIQLSYHTDDIANQHGEPEAEGEDKPRSRAEAKKKTAPVERFSPPASTMAEAQAVMDQLLNRSAAVIVKPPELTEAEKALHWIQRRILNNPHMIKYLSRPEGTFLTFPDKEYPKVFAPWLRTM